jgi:hypothetical protein
MCFWKIQTDFLKENLRTGRIWQRERPTTNKKAIVFITVKRDPMPRWSVGLTDRPIDRQLHSNCDSDWAHQKIHDIVYGRLTDWVLKSGLHEYETRMPPTTLFFSLPYSELLWGSKYLYNFNALLFNHELQRIGKKLHKKFKQCAYCL